MFSVIKSNKRAQHFELILRTFFPYSLIRFDGKNSVNNEELLSELDKLEVSTAETIYFTICILRQGLPLSLKISQHVKRHVF